MIEISHVRKRFGEQEVLADISFVADRESVGILGANGCGKTTLLKCILGLLDFEGEIRVGGLDVRREPIETKRKVGYIPQFFPIWPEVDVLEAMRIFGEIRGASARRQTSLLEEFGLGSHLKKRVGALSGGMRQKLSIAIALLSEPEVLILDEPTSSLDAWATQEVLSILSGLMGRKTVLLSSHRIEEVQSVTHRLIQIQAGKLVEPRLGSMSLNQATPRGGEGLCAGRS